MAAAHASGALALLLGVAPQAPAPALSEALRSSAIDLGAAGRDADFGAGRIDVCAAAAALPDATDPCTPAAAPAPATGPPAEPAAQPEPGATPPKEP
jgi:hypothetical protein